MWPAVSWMGAYRKRQTKTKWRNRSSKATTNPRNVEYARHTQTVNNIGGKSAPPPARARMLSSGEDYFAVDQPRDLERGH